MFTASSLRERNGPTDITVEAASGAAPVALPRQRPIRSNAAIEARRAACAGWPQLAAAQARGGRIAGADWSRHGIFTKITHNSPEIIHHGYEKSLILLLGSLYCAYSW